MVVVVVGGWTFHSCPILPQDAVLAPEFVAAAEYSASPGAGLEGLLQQLEIVSGEALQPHHQPALLGVGVGSWQLETPGYGRRGTLTLLSGPEIATRNWVGQQEEQSAREFHSLIHPFSCSLMDHPARFREYVTISIVQRELA